VCADQPHVITPRADPGVPVFALGRYAGARRNAIVAVKEHGRRDLVVSLARPLALGIHHLIEWGVAAVPLTVVPAPTRRSAARRRGGDPITRIAAAVDSHLPVVEKAIAAGADLLLVHHGIFWSGLQPLTGPLRRKVQLALDHDLAILSQHLPLDAPGAAVSRCRTM
jgi:hypothetical protein